MITLTQQDVQKLEAILMESPFKMAQPILAILTQAMQNSQPVQEQPVVEG